MDASILKLISAIKSGELIKLPCSYSNLPAMGIRSLSTSQEYRDSSDDPTGCYPNNEPVPTRYGGRTLRIHFIKTCKAYGDILSGFLFLGDTYYKAGYAQWEENGFILHCSSVCDQEDLNFELIRQFVSWQKNA